MTWRFEESWPGLRTPADTASVSSGVLGGDPATTTAALDQWLWGSCTGPLVLDGFLDRDLARRCEGEVRSLQRWERQCRAYVGNADPVDLDEADWATHPDRAALHDYYPGLADELTDSSTRGLQRFIGGCVTGRRLKDWLSARLGIAIGDRASFELVRYREGDQIRPHQDLIAGRMLAVLWYIDSSIQPGEGSALVVDHADGRTWVVEPTFNRIVIVPIRTDLRHQVMRRTSDRIGRYTASVGIYAPGY